MAEEATQAGNDQQDAPQTEEQAPAGEDQQTETPDEAEELRKQLAAKDEELKNTNAYVTRLQQGKGQSDEPATADAPQPDSEPDDGSQEYEKYGLTKAQVDALNEVTGAKEMREELAALKKEREEAQKQEQVSKMESDFAAIEKKYADKGVPLPTTPAEKERLLQFMDQNNIFNMDVAFREMHGSRLQTKSEEQPAAKSDRSDTIEPSNNENYKAALNALKAKAEKEGRRNPTVDELAEVEARFKGDPTMFANE